ncbi:L-arginine-binding protein-like [Glandiceps talaboti]
MNNFAAIVLVCCCLLLQVKAYEEFIDPSPQAEWSRDILTSYGQWPHPAGTLSLSALSHVCQRQDLIRSLVMFGVMGKEMGKTILETVQREQDNKMYTFQMDKRLDNPLAYIDDDMQIRGFSIDVLNEVCKEAGKHCQHIFEPFVKCIAHHAGELLAGPGLLGANFDACLLVFHSVDLDNVVHFSESYWKYEGQSRFYVEKGNPKNFDPADIKGRRIGFFRSWQSNRNCLVRHHVVGVETLYQSHIVYFDSILEAHQNFEDDKLDALFMLEFPKYRKEVADGDGDGDGDDKDVWALLEIPLDLEPIGDVLTCAEGVHVTTHKGSQLLDWYDKAFRKIKENGKYDALCHRAKTKHGHKGPIHCED